MSLRFWNGSIVVALTAAAAAGCSHVADSETAATKKVEEFRAKHEADYRKEYVALAGLAFLNEGANRAGSDQSNEVVLPGSVPASIGTFVLTGQQVRFEPKSGVAVTLKGQPAHGPIDLKSDGDGVKTPGAALAPPDELQIGAVTMWIHNSGDRRALRVRDEQGEVARTFTGFRWFPIESKYRVTGRFIKDPEPRVVQLTNLKGDFATYRTEGLVEFTFEGQTVRMRPMTTRPGRFFFIFRDATAGKETYAAARFLYTDLNPDGTTVLDFNEAYNPPCAFNPYTTCPLPPSENRLTVSIRAGEKDYDGPTRRTVTPTEQ